ncbi:MAG: lysylphosphatidylglycerol synthase domain-containing protein [Polyangia bacterium]
MTKKIVQLVSVAAALAALLWLLGRIGWSTIAGALHSVGVPGSLVLCALGLAETILDGAALCAVVGPRLRVSHAVAVNSAGSTLNLILPWESGEILKTGLMRGYFGSQPAISGTLIWNYIFKLSRPAVSASTAALAVILCPQASASTIAIVCAANALAFLPYLILRFVIRFGATEKAVKLIALLPGLHRPSHHWLDLARNIDREMRQFGQERRTAYLKVFCYQAVARMTGWWSIYAGFKLTHLPYGFAQATLVYATMNVAEYVIAILPARIGVCEGTAFFVFKFLGLEPTFGLILYLVLRIRTVLVNGVLTPLAFLRWDRSTMDPAAAAPPAPAPASTPARAASPAGLGIETPDRRVC